ncbi:hypothetical protein [Micromonospora zhanjiangensis]
MRTLLTLAAAAVCAAGALAVPATAAQADPAGTAPAGATVPADACAGTVQIQSLTFNPPRGFRARPSPPRPSGRTAPPNSNRSPR